MSPEDFCARAMIAIGSTQALRAGNQWRTGLSKQVETEADGLRNRNPLQTPMGVIGVG
jgi:hypothetical protein